MLHHWNRALCGGRHFLWLSHQKRVLKWSVLLCSSSAVALAATRCFLGGLLSSYAPFVFCSLHSADESREFSSERVMVWRLREQKRLTETQTEESRAFFCCERSESPAGGAA